MTARILIADADRRLSEIYREQLEGLGLAVRTAADDAVCIHHRGVPAPSAASGHVFAMGRL